MGGTAAIASAQKSGSRSPASLFFRRLKAPWLISLFDSKNPWRPRALRVAACRALLVTFSPTGGFFYRCVLSFLGSAAGGRNPCALTCPVVAWNGFPPAYPSVVGQDAHAAQTARDGPCLGGSGPAFRIPANHQTHRARHPGDLRWSGRKSDPETPDLPKTGRRNSAKGTVSWHSGRTTWLTPCQSNAEGGGTK